eukprot:6479542-Amphidinium_carterae.2
MAPRMGLIAAAGMTTWVAEAAYAPPNGAASFVRPVDKADPAMSSPWNLPVPLDDATLPCFTLPDPADDMPEKDKSCTEHTPCPKGVVVDGASSSIERSTFSSGPQFTSVDRKHFAAHCSV